MSEKTICEICGEPMPEGEEMFNYHGYSGPCPKPPLKRATHCEKVSDEDAAKAIEAAELHRLRIQLRNVKNALALHEQVGDPEGTLRVIAEAVKD